MLQKVRKINNYKVKGLIDKGIKRIIFKIYFTLEKVWKINSKGYRGLSTNI
jgi:hypothetical protein